MYPNTIRMLLKSYLLISLLPPAKLKEILVEIKKTIELTYPNYEIVIKRLYLYYDIKLVTFGINEGRNPIVQFPTVIQPYTQQQLFCIRLKWYQFLL